MNIPSRKECIAILNKNKTPSNVISHSKTVCKVAESIVKRLIENGTKVSKELVIAAALLHDIEREKKNHVIAGAKLIKKLGYPDVAKVMLRHTLYKLKDNEPKTIEEKVVFYADKRVLHDKIVSMEKRYEDLKKRYNTDLKWEMDFSKNIEKELLE